MFDASVPVFLRQMKSIAGVLTKAEAHATAKKLDPEALLKARLYPDMFHTIRQVQTATAQVYWGCALLSGLDRPDLPSEENSFADLQARISKAVDYAKGFTPDRINGSEDRAVALKFPGRTLDFTGKSFLFEFVLPNLFFHSAMTYAIMRHNGVEVGKQDFLARG
jgi:hypothetical protein